MPGRFFWKTGAGSLKATTPLTSSYRKNNSSRRDRKNNPLGEGERSCDRKNNSSRGDRKSKFDGERHQKNPALTATSYAQQPIEDAVIQEMEHGVVDSVGIFPPIRRIHSRRYEQRGNGVNSRSLFRRRCSTVARRSGPETGADAGNGARKRRRS